MTLNQTQATPAPQATREASPLSLIVLTNFFPAAHRAIRYAAELAAPIGAQLVLLHVQSVTLLEGGLLPPSSPERDGDLLVAVQALADETYVPTTVELVPDLQVSTAAALAKRYAPALFVLGVADEPEADGEVNEAVLEILRSGEFPLLVVPMAYHGAAAPTQAVAAADGEPFRLHHPAAALQLLRYLGPRLTVVTVAPTDDDHLSAAAFRQVRTSGLADAASHTSVQMVHDSLPTTGLLKAIAQLGADLVILVARRHSFLGAMFHRSVTNRLLRSCSVPMLVLPATES